MIFIIIQKRKFLKLIRKKAIAIKVINNNNKLYNDNCMKIKEAL